MEINKGDMMTDNKQRNQQIKLVLLLMLIAFAIGLFIVLRIDGQASYEAARATLEALP